MIKVGDLVRVNSDWGGRDTIGIVVDVVISEEFDAIAVTIHNGWQYRACELEVVSAGR